MTGGSLGNPAVAGFFGKLPARGDFVGGGLSAALVAAWHGWMQQRLAESRDELQDGWIEAWLVAPVWRFALPPGQCGMHSVTGLFLPSVDKVGRYFPLLAAIEGGGAGRDSSVPDATRFHDRLEDACRLALEQDWTPDRVLASLADIAPPNDAPARTGLWWSDGSPLVPAGAFEAESLPDGARFRQMLRA